MILRWLTLGLVPPAVAAGGLLSSEGGDTLYLRLALLGMVNLGMMAAAIMAWTFAHSRMKSIDDLLRPCAARDWVVDVIGRAYRPRRQATVVLIFSALPPVLALVDAARGRSDIAPLVLVSIVWSMALLGNVCYWLAVSPLLILRLLKCEDVTLRWHDPARTPGVRALSEGYLYAALFLALAAFAVTLPGLIDQPVFGAYLPYLYGLLISLSAWLAVLTHVGLYFVVRRFRLRLLDGLACAREFQATAIQSVELINRIGRLPSLSAALSAYDSIATAPGLPYGTGLVVPYTAAVAGSAIGLLLQ